MNTNSERSKGYAAILLATFLYGWFGVFVKLIGDHIPLFYQAWVRNVLVVALLLLYFVLSKQKIHKPGRKDAVKIVIRGILGVVAFTLGFVVFQKLSIGLAYILFFAGIFVGGFLIGRIFSNEKITAMKIVALTLSMIGVALAYVSRVEQSGDMLYIVLGFAAGIVTSGWNTFSHFIGKNLTDLDLNIYDCLVVAVCSFFISLILAEQWSAPSVSVPWAANLGMALMFVFTGILIPYGFRRVEAQIGSIIMPLELVFGIVFGVALVGEQANTFMIAGSVCIVIASVLPYAVALSNKTRTRRQ